MSASTENSESETESQCIDGSSDYYEQIDTTSEQETYSSDMQTSASGSQENVYGVATYIQNSGDGDSNVSANGISYTIPQSMTSDTGFFLVRSTDNEEHIYARIIEDRSPAEKAPAIYAVIGDGVTIEEMDEDEEEWKEKQCCLPSCKGSILKPYQLLLYLTNFLPRTAHFAFSEWAFGLTYCRPSPPAMVNFGYDSRTMMSLIRRDVKGHSRNFQTLGEELPLYWIKAIKNIVYLAKQKPRRDRPFLDITRTPVVCNSSHSGQWNDITRLKHLLDEAERRNNPHLLVTVDASKNRIAQLQQVIVSYYAQQYGVHETNMVAYVFGTQIQHYTSIMAGNILMAIAKTGQSILLPRPYNACLRIMLEAFQRENGSRIIRYKRDPSKSWALDINDLKSKINETTGAFFISSPSSYCGGVYNHKQWAALEQLLYNHHVPLVVDEWDDYMVYDSVHQKAPNVLAMKPRIPVILINASWRWLPYGGKVPSLGWVIIYDPNNSLPDRLHQHLGSLQREHATLTMQLPKPSILSTLLHFNGWSGDVIQHIKSNVDSAWVILRRAPGLKPVRPKAGYWLLVLVKLTTFGNRFKNDVDFVSGLFREENITVRCGSIMWDWPGSFALEMYMDHERMKEICYRILAFCERHASGP